MRADVLVDCRDHHGEGVLWSAAHGLAMWTDIHGQRVHALDPATGGHRTWAVPGRVCCFAPRSGRPATQLVCAMADGFCLLDLETGARSDIAAFEPGTPGTRLNDGRTDRRGRLIAGGMDEDALGPISSVCRLDPDLTVTTLFSGVACANSTCFSPDGATMYFADSPTGRIVAFPYDQEAGSVGAPRTVAETGAIPDGSCVDAEGFLWTAIWEGYRVERRAPDGLLDRVVEVGVAKPTCCAFGGAGLRTLFITTSRLGESEERLAREPHAGSLFAVEPGIAGLPDAPFAG
jgi:L-arabinonolactonase